jgi:hypothetical protein
MKKLIPTLAIVVGLVLGGGALPAQASAPVAEVALLGPSAATAIKSLPELRIDQARAPGIRPMECRRVRLPPKDPWFLCLNIGNPGTTVAARCKPSWKIVC